MINLCVTKHRSCYGYKYTMHLWQTFLFIIITLFVHWNWARPSYSYVEKTNDDAKNVQWNFPVEPWEPLTKPDHDDKQVNLVNYKRRSKFRWNNLDNLLFDHSRSYHHNVHKLTLLEHSGTKCNDGSPAGYYYRPAKHKNVNKWLIFLEGGWYCFDNETCLSRSSNAFLLFSSKFWFKTRSLGGILSSNSNVNPLYHEYHSVYIPYCSSDLWTGKLANRTTDYYFHGSRILRAVIDHLPWHLSPHTERVIFAGSSAGGIGVLMNVDRLSQRLFKKLGYPVLVSGIIDSAWFISIPPYQESECTNAFECPPEEGIHRGMKFWKVRIPKLCRTAQPKGQKWRCYLAPFIYRYLKTPVYIVQSLFDEAQMQMSKVPLLTGGTYAKWAYIQNLGKEVAKSLQVAKGVFAPSCLDHEFLTKGDWVHKMIGSVSLLNAIKAWDDQLIRQWIQQKFTFWPVQQPSNYFQTSSSHQHAHAESTKNDYSQLRVAADSIQTTRTFPSLIHMPKHVTNSTLIFFSRLVNMLNQKSHFKRHAPPSFTLKRFKRSYIFTKPTGHALTMTKQPINSPIPKSPHLNPNFFYNQLLLKTYHIIDSCGLFSINGISGSYLCDHPTQNTSSLPYLNYVPALDHLIPQCNPTCGFISNPQRIKLVDVLALYEVNTDLLANLLGITTSELKAMGSEQQMRSLFCGNEQIKKNLGRFILPQLSFY